jgi:hypothetical protein
MTKNAVMSNISRSNANNSTRPLMITMLMAIILLITMLPWSYADINVVGLGSRPWYVPPCSAVASSSLGNLTSPSLQPGNHATTPLLLLSMPHCGMVGWYCRARAITNAMAAYQLTSLGVTLDYSQVSGALGKAGYVIMLLKAKNQSSIPILILTFWQLMVLIGYRIIMCVAIPLMI